MPLLKEVEVFLHDFINADAYCTAVGIVDAIEGSGQAFEMALNVQLLLMHYVWEVPLQQDWILALCTGKGDGELILNESRIPVQVQGITHPMFAALSGNREFFKERPLPAAQSYPELLWQEINIGLEFTIEKNFSALFMVKERNRSCLEEENHSLFAVAQRLIILEKYCAQIEADAAASKGGKSAIAKAQALVQKMRLMRAGMQYRIDNCFKMLMRNYLALTRLTISAGLEKPFLDELEKIRPLAQALCVGASFPVADNLAPVLKQIQQQSSMVAKTGQGYIILEIERLAAEAALQRRSQAICYQMGYTDLEEIKVTPGVITAVMTEVKENLQIERNQALGYYSEKLVSARLQEVFYHELISSLTDQAQRILTQVVDQHKRLALQELHTKAQEDVLQCMAKQSQALGEEVVKIREELGNTMKLIMGTAFESINAQAAVALRFFERQSSEQTVGFMQLLENQMLTDFLQLLGEQQKATTVAVDLAVQNWGQELKTWQQDPAKFKYALVLQSSYQGALTEGMATPAGSVHASNAQIKKLLADFEEKIRNDLDVLPCGECKEKALFQVDKIRQELQQLGDEKIKMMTEQLEQAKQDLTPTIAPGGGVVVRTGSLVRVFTYGGVKSFGDGSGAPSLK